MTRKHFLVLIAVLGVLAAATAAIVLSERQGWQRSDARIGQKVIPGLKLGEVAEIVIRDGKGEVHLAHGGGGWSVRERLDFPADVERVGDLLLKAADLKVVQAERLPESQRSRLLLVEPAKDAKDAGTVLELKDAKGGALARLLLGRKIMKQAEAPAPGRREEGVPSGRYLLTAADSATMIAVSEPLIAAEARPEPWLAKELIRGDRVKSLQSLGPDGRQRWAMVRDSDNGYFRFVGSGGSPDLQKAQDAAGALGWMNVVDIVLDPINTETGLSRATTIKAETFDNITYTVRIGNRIGENYYVAVAVSGEPPKSRVADADEKPEDKEKKDKEFEARRKKLGEQVERERKLDKWRYIVGKNAVEPLLRDRTQLMPEKKARDSKG